MTKPLLLFLSFLVLSVSCKKDKDIRHNPISDSASAIQGDSLAHLVESKQTESLLKAIADRDIASVKSLIKIGANVNGKILIGSHSWESPLRLAVASRNEEIIKILLDNGADPNLDLVRSGTPFLCSAGGPTEILELLYEYGGKVHTISTEFDWKTPVNRAISEGKMENVKFLIEKNAIGPDTSYNYFSPLGTAIVNRQLEIAQYLLAKGVNINATFSDGSNDCITCPYGITVTHLAVSMMGWGEHEIGNEMLDLLLKYNPNLNVDSEMGFTPLEHVCFGTDTALVDKLITHGARLTTNQSSAIHCAAMFSNYQMVNYLLKKGANPNTKDSDGNTALSVSYDCCGDGFGEGITTEERIKTAELLLKYGADPSIKNNQGESFLDKCRTGHRQEMKEFAIKQKLI